MTATLSQTQADLPRLLEVISRGEDVVITVGGEPKARLTRVSATEIHQPSTFDGPAWIKELEDLDRQWSTGRNQASSEAILSDLRG